MPLSDEIKQAAEDLGKQLGADPYVSGYVRIARQAEQDAEVAALEARYNHLYQALTGREQNGEVLNSSEIDEYYRLKGEIQDHPLIVARDQQLILVNETFAETAQRLTAALGIDYTTFAA